jgi:hypothetical protein
MAIEIVGLALRKPIVELFDLGKSRRLTDLLRVLTRRRPQIFSDGRSGCEIVRPVNVGSGRRAIEIVGPALRQPMVDPFNLGKSRRLIDLLRVLTRRRPQIVGNGRRAVEGCGAAPRQRTMALITGFRRYIAYRPAARAQQQVQLPAAFAAEIGVRRVVMLAKPACLKNHG